MMIFSIVKDEDGTPHTKCPHCGALDSINEKDIAVRWNRLTLSDDGTSATASLGDTDFDGDCYICETCIEECDGPEGFEILDWS